MPRSARFTISEQLFAFVKRPNPLLVLLPLSLLLGYGSGHFIRNSQGEKTANQEQIEPEASRKLDDDQIRELWRSRFLQIIEQPSFALQSSSFYAVSKELTIEDMPYFLEAMHPEGWVRFRGDLPLAIFMEWAKRDSKGLSLYTEYLFTEYPYIKDNLDGVFFNLGLQNAPGSIATLAAVSNKEAKDFLATRFLDGLEDEHPDQVFSARFQILGPKNAFSNIRAQELDQAVEEYWKNSARYLQEKVEPNMLLALEIGKRFQDSGIHLLNTSNQLSSAIAGSIAKAGTASAQTLELLNTTQFNWREIEKLLDEEEKRTLVAFLSTQETYWKENNSGIGPNMISSGLDRETTKRLINIPDLPIWTRNHVLSQATKLFSREEYLLLLEDFDDETLAAGLNNLIDSGTAKESAQLLSYIPQEWRTPELVNIALEKALVDGNLETFAKVCSDYSEHQRYLPNSKQSANVLWHQNPELYLKNIESADSHIKQQHLMLVTTLAEEEELGMILESGTFEQQTDVLIRLIHSKPELSIEILKHEDPDSIRTHQAAQIGVSLSYGAEPETAYSYFQESDLKHPNNQIAALNYCLSEIMMGESLATSESIAQISNKHDYIFRTAKALIEETENPESLLALRNEDPDTFLNALSSQIQQNNNDALRKRARALLVTANLSLQEKQKIHQALYGSPQL